MVKDKEISKIELEDIMTLNLYEVCKTLGINEEKIDCIKFNIEIININGEIINIRSK